MTSGSSHASRSRYDVVVVGGGHNGLVSAAYLARAGLSVAVLERLDHVGGAAVSAQPFAGHDARLSRYSYLVSLLPRRLVEDLGLDLTLVSRPTASYTPVLRGARASGLLVERPEGEATRRSFRDLTGSDEEYDAWRTFYAEAGQLAATVAPTLLEPLPLEPTVRSAVPARVWDDFVTRPLGDALRRRFRDDTVRGVVATDGLIGTFASLDAPSLVQNRCLLYHLIAPDGGDGEWRVPVGGMGAVTDALARAAVDAGAELVTSAGVSGIRTSPDADGSDGSDAAEVSWTDASGAGHTVGAGVVLAGVAPWVLEILLGGPEDTAGKPAGSQLKINLLVDRLPRLRSGVDPEVAFAGTLHVGEDLTSLEAAWATAAAGRLPDRLPGEVYCHTLTDPSILGDDAGRHTLTYFGLHTPAGLFAADNEATKAAAVELALAELDRHLVDPIASCLTRDATGEPCVEAKSPVDVEADLAMPGGHIFHGDLEWPWAPARARLETPAERWGVQTGVEAVMLCGSGARRGGAVSGIGGHNAARAVLESR